jgi:hypothetical protein
MEKDDKLSYNVQLHIDLTKNIANYAETESIFKKLASKAKRLYNLLRFILPYLALKLKVKSLEYEKSAIHQEKAVKNLSIHLAYVESEIEQKYQPPILEKMAKTSIVEKIRTWRHDNPKMPMSDPRHTMVEIYTKLQNDKNLHKFEELLGYKTLLNLYEKYQQENS